MRHERHKPRAISSEVTSLDNFARARAEVLHELAGIARGVAYLAQPAADGSHINKVYLLQCRAPVDHVVTALIDTYTSTTGTSHTTVRPSVGRDQRVDYRNANRD